MKKLKMKLALCALLGFVLIPASSEAASAVAVTDNTGLFVVTFDFIAGDEDYLIPIGATYGLDHGATSSFAGYKVFSGDKEVNDIVQSNGITLSSQKVVDGRYYQIKAGQRARFTTVAVVEVPETKLMTHYHVELSHLPHLIGGKRTEVSADRVNRFRSEALILNKEIIGDGVTIKMK